MNNNEIDIAGLDKAKLLQALFNRSFQQGLGVLDSNGTNTMTLAEALNVINDLQKKGRKLYFDYLKGRILKVDISGDTLFTALYNRDVGYGAAEAIVNKLRLESEHG